MEVLRGPGRKVRKKHCVRYPSLREWVGLTRKFFNACLFVFSSWLFQSCYFLYWDGYSMWLGLQLSTTEIISKNANNNYNSQVINFMLCSYRNSTQAVPHRAELFWFPHWCVLIAGPFVFICSFLHLLIGRWFTGIFVSF